jgi:hypothetical protein
LKRNFDGDNHEEFTHEDRNSISIYGNKIYQVGTCQINYTTYDNRRDYDTINPSTHPDVMVLSGEDDQDEQPYWYARVLGIYHANVSTSHPEAHEKAMQRMPFLLVRWFGAEPEYKFGFKRARLPMVGFVPYKEEYDNFPFGFLDPAQVIRGCLLVPRFSFGRTETLLPFKSDTARQVDIHEEDPNLDFVNYYVDMWVNSSL